MHETSDLYYIRHDGTKDGGPDPLSEKSAVIYKQLDSHPQKTSTLQYMEKTLTQTLVAWSKGGDPLDITS